MTIALSFRSRILRAAGIVSASIPINPNASATSQHICRSWRVYEKGSREVDDRRSRRPMVGSVPTGALRRYQNRDRVNMVTVQFVFYGGPIGSEAVLLSCALILSIVCQDSCFWYENISPKVSGFFRCNQRHRCSISALVRNIPQRIIVKLS
jgi:hypothetical protein